MLIFISNSLISPYKLSKLRIEATFIGFGITDGKMFSYYNEYYTIPEGIQLPHGNRNIFGIIISIPDEQFYLQKLDAYHNCSLSQLMVNHRLDLNHRQKRPVIPLNNIETLDDLSRHKYTLGTPINCWVYHANIHNPAISTRIAVKKSRVLSGINAQGAKEAFQLLI